MLDDVVPSADIASEVVFAVSGRSIPCTEADTILTISRQAGLNIPSGCTFGVCGTCKTRKLAGEVHMVHNGGISGRGYRGGLYPCLLLASDGPRRDRGLGGSDPGSRTARGSGSVRTARPAPCRGARGLRGAFPARVRPPPGARPSAPPRPPARPRLPPARRSGRAWSPAPRSARYLPCHRWRRSAPRPRSPVGPAPNAGPGAIGTPLGLPDLMRTVADALFRSVDVATCALPQGQGHSLPKPAAPGRSNLAGRGFNARSPGPASFAGHRHRHRHPEIVLGLTGIGAAERDRGAGRASPPPDQVAIADDAVGRVELHPARPGRWTSAPGMGRAPPCTPDRLGRAHRHTW